MSGPVEGVVFAVVTAMIGVALFSVGLMGFYVRPLPWVSRLGFLITGIATLIPVDAFEGAIIFNITGGVSGVILVLFERTKGVRRVTKNSE